MQAIRVAEGDRVDYTPDSAVKAGDVVVQNGFAGIASRPIAAGEQGALDTEGLFDIVKVTGAINAWAAIYWDADGDPVGGTAGTGAATTTSSGNTFMGWAVRAALSGDETVRVLFAKTISVSNTIHQALTAELTDPGDAGAIPVGDTGSCALVTAKAETRTLAAPANAGQLLALCLRTDGGDCVITASAAINQAGNNTITLNNAGDTIVLVGVKVGSDLVWRVLVNVGCVLSTV